MKYLVFILLMLIVGCKCHDNAKKDFYRKDSVSMAISGPQAIIYRTKADYRELVPVILSNDKSKIVSYPGVDDIKIGNNFTIPDKLHNGYLLDRRGITLNVAFLKFSYSEYFGKAGKMSTDELYKSIIDKDPLIEMFDCGKLMSFRNPVEDLNKLIDENKILEKFKKIK